MNETHADNVRILASRNAEFREAYGFGIPDALSDYRPCQVGSWAIRSRRGGIGQSYASQTVIDADYHTLSNGSDLWMSTAFLERESHAWHLEQSTGHVVIAGLGIGMITLAAARKPDVTRVTVFEIDKAVIDLFLKAVPHDRSIAHKITLCHGDAGEAAAMIREMGPREIDYAYADIWREYPHADAASWARNWIASLNAKAGGFWGQEAEIARRCEQGQGQMSIDTLSRHLDAMGIPVLPTPGYATFVSDVALAHGLAPDDHA